MSGIPGWHPTGLRKLCKLNKACQRDEGPRWEDSDWRRPFKLFILINTATNRTSNTDTNTAANTDTDTDISTDTNRGSNTSLQYTNRLVSLLSKVFRQQTYGTNSTNFKISLFGKEVRIFIKKYLTFPLLLVVVSQLNNSVTEQIHVFF